MADNYLEKRYAEVFGNTGSGRKLARQRPPLDVLLSRNRTFRGFQKDYVVHQLQLDAIVAVNTRVASGMNAQRLRFRTLTRGAGAELVLRHIRLGASLRELGLPLPGTEPEAFIVVCATCPENPIVDIDLGISLQSMSLKAVEMGLGCVMIRAFDREAIRQGLGLPLDPIAVLAVGKPAETVELVTVHEGDSLTYYRKDGVHYVPKLSAEDLKI